MGNLSPILILDSGG